MAELKFETGLKTFSLNGKIDVEFNPTDSAFVERLFETFDTLDKKQEAYKSEMEQAKSYGGNKKIFEIARRRDDEIRQLLDGVFEAPVCEAVFGKMNVYALSDGLPVWVNLMLAVMDEIDTSFAREQKQTNPRIAKYTAKYHV